jgi:DNA polymerase III epsilon subunit-like protein
LTNWKLEYASNGNIRVTFSQPMRVLVLDTETTGLFPKGPIALRDPVKCPHIMQLSYMVYDTNTFKIIEDYDAIIRLAAETEISEKSIEIHGITREKCLASGVPINVALFNLRTSLYGHNVSLIVGHNISFDKQMIDVECVRCGLAGLFRNEDGRRAGLWNGETPLPLYCTMEHSKEMCNFRSQSMYGGTFVRFGKLKDVFDKLFSEVDVADDPKTSERYAEFMHNSRVDVVMCLRIFAWIVYGIDIKTEWRDVMETYTDANFITIDDVHLLSLEDVVTRYELCCA